MNILLTGEKSAGKTTVCLKLTNILREHSNLPKGILTPAIFDSEGTKIGFQALNVETNERWLLAHKTITFEGSQVGSYSFDNRALNRAISVLGQALKSKLDVLFLDEIGPLELKSNKGFASILNLIPHQTPYHLIIVIRPHLIPNFTQKYGEFDFKIIPIDQANRNQAPQKIFQQYLCK